MTSRTQQCVTWSCAFAKASTVRKYIDDTAEPPNCGRTAPDSAVTSYTLPNFARMPHTDTQLRKVGYVGLGKICGLSQQRRLFQPVNVQETWVCLWLSALINSTNW